MLDSRPRTRAVHRLQLAVVSAGLTLACFLQAPGLTTSDTKADLVLDPGGFLGRALSLWDQQANFGQIQNQAFGYFFPMGPFFLIGHMLGVPPWITQRAWMSLLVVVAFLGIVRLAGRLGIGTPTTRMVAGVAYAIAPRTLMLISATSAELLPMAMLPWVLIPLVGPEARRRPRRAAALSGIAVLCMGGINAAATTAVLVLPLFWLLTRPAGSGRFRLLGWWLGAVALATSWWLLPVLLMGRYGFSFLPYSETASTTTGLTSMTEVLRGSDHWLSYLAVGGEPWSPAGWQIVTSRLVIAGTIAVAAAGLAGLATRDLPERRFLVGAVLIGVVVMTAGYAGSVGGPFHGAVRDALDGPLAVFRNVHKFEPVMRLPLALGFAHLLHRVALRVPSARVPARVIVGAAVVALVAAAVPAYADKLAPRGTYEEMPGYWRAAAHWIDRHEGEDMTLAVPAATFGQFTWGRPLDDPLQALLNRPWASRSQLPLSSEGNVRFLDAVTEQLESGRPSTGFANYLARAGVRYVLVRNDLDRTRLGGPFPAVIHRALDGAPPGDFSRIATFGPYVAGNSGSKVTTVDRGLDVYYPAVEIYLVKPAVDRVRTYPVDGAVTVSGGPESLLQLDDAGVLGDRAAIFAGDVGADTAADAPRLVTDGLRRREIDFGLIRENGSATLTPTDPIRRDRPARDFLPLPGLEHEAVAGYAGARDVRASSSSSDPGSVFFRGPQHLPYAAIDGDRTTSWVTGPESDPVGQWWEVDLDHPVDAASMTVRFLDDPRAGPPITAVEVSTDTGKRRVTVEPTGAPQDVALPDGSTRTIRITVTGIADTGDDDVREQLVGIREVDIPGVSVSRTIVAPSDSTGSSVRPAVFSFARAPGQVNACVVTVFTTPCNRAIVRPGEETGPLDRTFTLDRPGRFTLHGTARPRPGPELDAFLNARRALKVTASSQYVRHPWGGPTALVDGETRTGWVAAPGDRRPSVTLSWDGKRTIDRLRITETKGFAASRPDIVSIISPAGVRQARVGDHGVVTFDPLVTDRMTIRFLQVVPRIALETSFGTRGQLPVGVSELDVRAVRDLAFVSALAARTDLPCGSGPDLTVDGVTVPTRLETTTNNVRALDNASVEICTPDGTLHLARGAHRIIAPGIPTFAVQSLTLARRGWEAPTFATDRVSDVLSWSSEHRRLRVAPGDAAYLAVRENFNDGWHATLDGHDLRPVRLDDWQQGFVVPAGKGGVVHLDFTPGRAYHVALGLGALGVIGLIVLAATGSRRPRALAPAVGRRARRGRVRTWLPLAGATAVLGVAAGPVGAASVIVLAVVRRRWRADIWPWLAGGALGAAGLIAVVRPWTDPDPGAFSWPAQTFAVIALAAVTAVAFTPARQPRPERAPTS